MSLIGVNDPGVQTGSDVYDMEDDFGTVAEYETRVQTATGKVLSVSITNLRCNTRLLEERILRTLTTQADE